MSGGPPNQWGYVFVEGEGNKGANYRDYKWKPEMRQPPGVKNSRVFLGVVGMLSIAAIPAFLFPYLFPAKGEKESMHASHKQKMREERMKWAKSDDMPSR